MVIDVNGYFAPPAAGGLSLYALTPCRVLDTRNSPGRPPTAGTVDVSVVLSGCGAPAVPIFVMNATVVPPAHLASLLLAAGHDQTACFHAERARWRCYLQHGNCSYNQRLNQFFCVKPSTSCSGYFRIFRAVNGTEHFLRKCPADR